MTKANVRNEILQLIQDLGGQAKSKQLTDALPERTKGEVAGHLRRAVEAGVLRKVSRGVYAVNGPDGASTAASTATDQSDGAQQEPKTRKRNTPWAAAGKIVLKGAGKGMHYKDITDQIIERGLRHKIGSKPSSTLYGALYRDCQLPNSECALIDPGVFILRTVLEDLNAPVSKASKKRGKTPGYAAPSNLIEVFGMYWMRDKVDWTSSKPSLWGGETVGSDPIDFSEKTGIYLLHDGARTVYVGRATDQSLAKRLRQHTRDRLISRWDRFSWFGLAEDWSEMVDEHGWHDLFVIALEGTLIEALEPTQNRRSGDNMSEMIQREDLALVEARKKKVVQESFLQFMSS